MLDRTEAKTYKETRMDIDRYPTHLGGELEGVEWYQLTPEQLMRACCGSTIKAAGAAILAKEQAAAADELGLDQEARDYLEVADFLARIGDHKSLVGY